MTQEWDASAARNLLTNDSGCLELRQLAVIFLECAVVNSSFAHAIHAAQQEGSNHIKGIDDFIDAAEALGKRYESILTNHLPDDTAATFDIRIRNRGLGSRPSS